MILASTAPVPGGIRHLLVRLVGPSIRVPVWALGLAMIPALEDIAMAQPQGNPTTDAGSVVKPLERRQPYHPDHLVPSNPNPGDWKTRYTEALRKQINLDSPFFVRMVEMPSFEGESSLRLSATNDTKDITKVDAFVLTFYQADTSIWYSMPENNQEKIRKQVVVSVKSAPLPKATALRVHAVWERMIHRVRKPEQPDSTLDGVSYEFATQSGKGESHNPGWNRQSPDRLVALGQSLRRYCEVKASQRKSSLEMIEIHLRRLEEYLDGHPMK